MKYLFAILFTAIRILTYAQEDSMVDSLQQMLVSSAEDSSKVILLNDLAWELKFDAPKKAAAYLREASILAQRTLYPKGEAQAYNTHGVVATIHSQYDTARHYYNKALIIREAIGDQKGVASLFNNLGNLEEEVGHYVEALSHLRKSLSIREILKDTQRIARVSYNISIIHEAMGNYVEAMDYLFQYRKISEQLGDEYGVANAYNVMGNVKFELERFDEALDFYEQSLTIREKLGDQRELFTAYNNKGIILDELGEKAQDDQLSQQAGVYYEEAIECYKEALAISETLEMEDESSTAYNNLGLVYKNLGSFYQKTNHSEKADAYFTTAIKWLNRSLVIREILENKAGVMEVYNGLGDVYRRQKYYAKALGFTKKYLAIAQAIGDDKFIQKAFKDLSRLYAAIGDFKQAYDFRKAYDEMRYQRLDERRVKNFERQEILYSDGKKQEQINQQQQAIALQDAELGEAAILRNSLIGGAIALLLLILLLYNRYLIKHRSNIELSDKNEIINKERKRSDDLLLNILPESIAAELKEKGTVDAQSYPLVSVLFTDFESFTRIAENIQADELVKQLDLCFKKFDEIIGKYSIEKIKTIGDSYMCAAGLPKHTTSHAHDLVQAAIEMQDFMQELNQSGQCSFIMRLGIHSGSVVAGVVGSKKFAYDIWGDTVNMAARMESSGKGGKVNISEDTYQLVKDDFHCEHRGKIKAKNKGEVDMYFVENS